MTYRLFVAAVLVIAASCSQPDRMQRVRIYQQKENSHDVEGILEMFAADARLDFGLLGVIKGRDEIRDIHEYDRALNTTLRFEDCRENGTQISCRTIETNDWLATAGIKRLIFTETSFIFDDSNAIKLVNSTLSPESSDSLVQAIQEFDGWARENEPEKYARLFRGDGSFNYSYESGLKVLALLREWRSARSQVL